MTICKSLPLVVCLLVMFTLPTACATSPTELSSPSSREGSQTDLADVEETERWLAYPIIAHLLRGEEAPIVRWIDTDGDGVSNYRLLCTFENGRVQVRKVVVDRSFKQKFNQARI